MNATHELIEAVLENLKEVHTGLNKDVENLVESGICDEEDLVDTKATIDKIYKFNLNLQNLLLTVLSEDYDSQKVKKDLMDLRLLRALKRDRDESGPSVLEWFCKKIESSNN
ncbi:MAG: hypothetical protein EBR60_06120 [Burkholderiaceae bacterium]|nr:hypothetical protein [Burkholderiaceae bacterium]